jgi:hypothetical protein
MFGGDGDAWGSIRWGGALFIGKRPIGVRLCQRRATRVHTSKCEADHGGSARECKNYQ